jgi:hypothetical protein
MTWFCDSYDSWLLWEFVSYVIAIWFLIIMGICELCDSYMIPVYYGNM